MMNPCLGKQIHFNVFFGHFLQSEATLRCSTGICFLIRTVFIWKGSALKAKNLLLREGENLFLQPYCTQKAKIVCNFGLSECNRVRVDNLRKGGTSGGGKIEIGLVAFSEILSFHLKMLISDQI